MSVELPHSPADILRIALIDAGVGVTHTDNADWSVRTGTEADKPDNCLTTYNTTGRDDGRTMDGDLQTHYGVQLRIRSKTEVPGWAKADMARATMSHMVDVTVTIGSNTYLLHCVTNIGTIMTLGTDNPNSKRKLFTINVMLVITNTTP